MSAITWDEHPAFDDRPVYGPPCPGVATHSWSLSIDCGEWFLTSGCQECDWTYESEDVLMRPIPGRMVWEREHAEADCPSFLDGPCDHAYWVRFIPARELPDGIPEDLYVDIESAIHLHMGHDGQSDEANDWVTDLMSAITPFIERALTGPLEAGS